jgi:hypothetical protein
MSNYDQGYYDATNSQPSCPPFGDTARNEYNDGYMAGTFDLLAQFFEESTQ